MTHREMVILSPQRGITVTREQMEAHLSLHGWRPVFVGRGAAIKDELVVYAFGGDESNTGGVGTAKQTLTQLNLDPDHTGVCDSWYMSDKYFWPLAHACVEVDNQGLR